MAGRSNEFVYGDGQTTNGLYEGRTLALRQHGVPEHVARAIAIRELQESLYPAQAQYNPYATQQMYNPMTGQVYNMQTQQTQQMYDSIAQNQLMYQLMYAQQVQQAQQAYNPTIPDKPRETFSPQFQSPQMSNIEHTYRPSDTLVPTTPQNTPDPKF